MFYRLDLFARKIWYRKSTKSTGTNAMVLHAVALLVPYLFGVDIEKLDGYLRRY